jgi:hypothetical protein
MVPIISPTGNGFLQELHIVLIGPVAQSRASFPTIPSVLCEQALLAKVARASPLTMLTVPPAFGCGN